MWSLRKGMRREVRHVGGYGDDTVGKAVKGKECREVRQSGEGWNDRGYAGWRRNDKVEGERPRWRSRKRLIMKRL